MYISAITEKRGPKRTKATFAGIIIDTRHPWFHITEVNSLACKVKWSRSIIGCSLNAAFVCFYQIGNKVYISTPASKDMNTVMDAYYCTSSIIILSSPSQYIVPGDSRHCVIMQCYYYYATGYLITFPVLIIYTSLVVCKINSHTQ